MFADVTEFYKRDDHTVRDIAKVVYCLEGFVATQFENTETFREGAKEVARRLEEIESHERLEETESNGWLPLWIFACIGSISREANGNSVPVCLMQQWYLESGPALVEVST